MDVIKESIQGKKKKSLDEKIMIKEQGKLLFVGLARGEQKGIGKVGAEITLDRLFHYIINQDIHYFMENFPDQKQYEMIEDIREGLKEEAGKREIDVRELSANFCGLIIDQSDGEFLLFHLGDSMIYGINQSGKYRVISAPEYGPTKYHTYFSMSKDALSHIRFAKGNLNFFQSLLIFSPGARKISEELKYGIKSIEKNTEEKTEIKNRKTELKKEKTNYIIKEIIDKTEKLNFLEDASVVIMTNL